ncbi:hypothetical protein VTI74DRAFT_488 [Chaetomium olivicolor]
MGVLMKQQHIAGFLRPLNTTANLAESSADNPASDAHRSADEQPGCTVQTTPSHRHPSPTPSTNPDTSTVQPAMSQKITSKNLQYTSTLPPFLARLRGQSAAETDPDAPDPILAARRRPGKKRSASAEAEDAPLVVDKQGNVVGDVTVGVDGSVKEREGAEVAGMEGEAEENNGRGGETASTENVAGIGEMKKKRRIGKVVGAGADEEEEAIEQKKEGKQKAAKPGNTTSSAKEHIDSASAGKRNVKKKAKKIKLSFGEEEG